MDDDLEDSVKIWRYMDVGKFLSLLHTQSLYFACPTEFDDPFEGFVPQSHVNAYSSMLKNIVRNNDLAINQFLAQYPDARGRIDEIRSKLSGELSAAFDKVRLKFGVSCWHRSEHESEAMWRLYSGSGPCVAIESSVGQLRLALSARGDLQIVPVRYMDFDRDPIEKGHKFYGLFLKRKSFENEKEVRATVLLPARNTREDSMNCA